MENILKRAYKRILNDLWFKPDPALVLLVIIVTVIVGAALGFFG